MDSIMPSELLVIPQPLIGLSGLDIVKNPIHKSIWDTFSSNRKPDRALMQFKLLSPNYEFPVSKPKRPSYEWYYPKGILKRNWMLKHLHVLPAVVVLFQEIEWNEPAWNVKKSQCAQQVKSLKDSLQNHNTRLVVVLLQRAALLPPGEDILASERASSLANACDLNAKLLLVLPHNDHLMGYTLRLESAFLELAQSYYTQMAKQVKGHREQLTQNHQNLRIRHQFKLGFISEMRIDYSTALKYYTQCYASLDEIRIVDTNCFEIKTVAGFVNNKICKLKFKLNVPRDSITQFIGHIDKYRNRIGFKELMFEHYAWLSVQYSSFAELFCDAIKNGLPALQTQHPGIYYHKAAEYVGRRKETFLQCCALAVSPTELSAMPISSNVLQSEFFGVRGARTSEPITEQQIISVVQEQEKSFNHSIAIIALLGQAMAQFKVYKCLRFRKKLAIDMAEEYLKNGDHAKAHTLYSLMLSDYRIDKWYRIFTEVLLKTLRSAYLSSSVNDFILCSIEAMSPRILIDRNERIVILENLWKVFQNVAPVALSQIAPELVHNWDVALATQNVPCQVDLDKISDLFECKYTFEHAQIKLEERIVIELYIRSKTNVPLKLRSFALVVTDATLNYKIYSNRYQVIGEPSLCTFSPDTFMLEPAVCYKFIFYGEPYQFMENIEIQIARLEITIGSERRIAVLAQSGTLNRAPAFKGYRCGETIDKILQHSTCYVIPTFQLTTKIDRDDQPMLVNEYYKVITNISNTFDICLQQVGISIVIPQQLRGNVFLTTDLTEPRQKLLSSIQIDIGDLQMQTCTTITYYIISLVEGNLQLQQRLWYQTEHRKAGQSTEMSPQHLVESPVADKAPPLPTSVVESLSRKFTNHNITLEYTQDRVKKAKDDIISLACVAELSFTGRLYTLSRQALGRRAYKDENLIFRVSLEVRAPNGLEIVDAVLITDHNLVEPETGRFKKSIAGNYANGISCEDVRFLRATSSTNEWISYAKHCAPKKEAPLFPVRRIEKSQDSQKLTAHNRIEDTFTKNLLSKIPSNTTIIGNASLVAASQVSGKLVDDELARRSPQQQDDSGTKSAHSSLLTKHVFNRAEDGLVESIKRDKRRGFFTTSTTKAASTFPQFGLYCVKWRRSSSNATAELNESKFAVRGVEIIDAPLNIFYELEREMHVRVLSLYKITIKNPHKRILHLQAVMNNSDNFMFSGPKQFNVSIFAYSSHDINFNILPLKAGWQTMPEIQLEYNTQFEGYEPDAQLQSELNELTKRWLPMKAFIFPPQRG